MKNSSLVSKMRVIQNHLDFKTLGLSQKHFHFNILTQTITCDLIRTKRDRTLVRASNDYESAQKLNSQHIM
jgi:hypothetical protein